MNPVLVERLAEFDPDIRSWIGDLTGERRTIPNTVIAEFRSADDLAERVQALRIAFGHDFRHNPNEVRADVTFIPHSGLASALIVLSV